MKVKEAYAILLALHQKGRTHFHKGELNKTVEHKVLYYSEVLSLHLSNKPLFDKDFEAWEYGPVMREIWDMKLYKPDRRNNFFGKKENIYEDNIKLLDDVEANFDMLVETDSEFSRAVDFISIICQYFTGERASGLSKKTHEKGTAWDELYKKGMRNIPIPKERMKRDIGAIEGLLDSVSEPKPLTEELSDELEKLLISI